MVWIGIELAYINDMNMAIPAPGWELTDILLGHELETKYQMAQQL